LLDVVLSVQKLPIRLTDARWAHITEEHCELSGLRLEVLETIVNPSLILSGGAGEQLAVRELSSARHLVVVYRQLLNDGFIITAFLTSKTNFFRRRPQLWP